MQITVLDVIVHVYHVMEELVIIVYHVLNICFYNQHLIHAFSIVVLTNIMNILQTYVYHVIFHV